MLNRLRKPAARSEACEKVEAPLGAGLRDADVDAAAHADEAAQRELVDVGAGAVGVVAVADEEAVEDVERVAGGQELRHPRRIEAHPEVRLEVEVAVERDLDLRRRPDRHVEVEPDVDVEPRRVDQEQVRGLAEDDVEQVRRVGEDRELDVLAVLQRGEEIALLGARGALLGLLQRRRRGWRDDRRRRAAG
jgi:hypothetical protein